jgi:hypothetical protein
VNALVFDAAGFIVDDLDKDRDLFAAEEHLHRALAANCEARAKEAAFIRNASALLQAAATGVSSSSGDGFGGHVTPFSKAGWNMTNLDDHEASTLGHESYHAHAATSG